MTTSRTWSIAGIVAGVAGLATSYAVAMALTIRDSPVVAVAERVIAWTPGKVAEYAVRYLGQHDKTVLLLVIVLVLLALFAWAGRLAGRTWWAPAVLFTVLAGLGGWAVLAQHNATSVDLVPVATGLVTWLVCLSLLTDPLRRRDRAASEQASEQASEEAPGRDPFVVRGESATPGEVHDHTRRTFLLRASLMTAVAAVLGTVGRGIGRGRRHVEETRRLLKLPGVTLPQLPPGVRVDVPGVTPWQTPTDDFYLIHTAIAVPTIEPADWTLRIHGMVDREIVLTYSDLIARRTTQAWITLNCVSNEVGGTLVGNAWWSGVRVADLLAEAGVRPGADAVLQTSEDGWTCATPIEALTDDRDALLAVAMNGKPLPLEHGFPVRTIVPGLYGYVSATKWVVDLEVTRFEDVEAFWTQRGWAERGPVKIASRIDVPRNQEVPPGPFRVAGVAWAQQTGIAAVEIAVDGGAWQPTTLAEVPHVDTWVQWATTLDLAPGEHRLRVRAIDRAGVVQTGVVAPPVPDGATGWDEAGVRVLEEA
ncbi:molybdopterin-dependent oxidoreductase [Nocardioides ochotonae]|uniref:molybdopterin-dependent oxidoreductase n=1 Tax=Nocardioides ochotonae TaxID=2685869 RepID=UPI00313345FE